MGTALEGQDEWDDRVFMTRNGQRAWLFERVLLTDRSASFRGEFCGGRNQRIASEAYEAVKDRASKWWWEPSTYLTRTSHCLAILRRISSPYLPKSELQPHADDGLLVRRSVLKFAGVEDEILNLALRYNSHEPPKPVINYISRQEGGRRMLRTSDHEGLVTAIRDLAEARGWEFNVVNAQHLTQEEQLAVAARTTVCAPAGMLMLKTHLMGRRCCWACTVMA